jgi:hypothetical protein
MREHWQKWRLPASIACTALILHAVWLWQPERQLRLHHQHFIAAAEDRDWKEFTGFIDDAFADRWGHDRPAVVRECSEILRQFFALSIKSEIIALKIEREKGEILSTLKLEGNGTPIAQYAMRAVNELNEPFTFEWRRKSWKPWDWRLVRADHPRLRVPDAIDF